MAFVASIPAVRFTSVASRQASSLRGIPVRTARASAPAEIRRAFWTAPAMAIKKGDPAPAFSAKDQKGNTVSLSDFKDKSAVCLFFYPKDETPGCTKQACAFRDAVDEFKSLDATVIGVSSGSASEHSAFDDKFSLQFPLLVDEGSKMRKAFGVPSTFGVLPGRVTYIIDKSGIVQEVYNSQLNVLEHVAVARRTLATFAK